MFFVFLQRLPTCPHADPSKSSKYALPILVFTSLLERHPLDLVSEWVGLRLTAELESLPHRTVDILTDAALIISP
jgi:hypothetical protein